MTIPPNLLSPFLAPLPPSVLATLESLSLTTPLNFLLLLLTIYLTLSLLSPLFSSPPTPTSHDLPNSPDKNYNWRPEKHQEAIVWRKWTPRELCEFDGKQKDSNGGEGEGKILFAIRRKVYDVSSGRNFYGPGAYLSHPPSPSLPSLLSPHRRRPLTTPLGETATEGGPYSTFAGRDASRGLAKQSFDEDMLTPLDEPIDELKDLTKSEWGNLKDWESHFQNKYILCGDYVQE